MNIDFVVAWVDGSDEQWLRKKEKYSSDKHADKGSAGSSRYRDWDIFKYWFRSVEKNAPWVNKIFLVTDHQIPDFLLPNDPKLEIVYHDDYIPKEYLPTFSSHTIELNFHRIKGLSEHFVYFNDDTMLNRPVLPTDFFKNGKPCYELIERPLSPLSPTGIMPHICLNNMGVINRHFSRKNVYHHFGKFANFKYGRSALKNLMMLPWRNYQHFQDNHMPCPFLKSTFCEVWDKAYDVCDITCSHKFRTYEDLNQYVFKYWDLARGNFHPYHFVGGYYCISENNVDSIISDITRSEHMMICINDSEYMDEARFFEIKKKLTAAFECRYPQKSSFEV